MAREYRNGTFAAFNNRNKKDVGTEREREQADVFKNTFMYK